VLILCGRHSPGTFLLVDILFPIIGVVLLWHFCLMVDLAANRLVGGSFSFFLPRVDE